VVVDAPETTIRKVEICSDAKKQKHEKIVLYLRRGDGYSMDGEMQLNYTHGVPEAGEERGGNLECNSDPSTNQRISIVFRHGIRKVYDKASGKPCTCQLFNPYTRVKTPVYFGAIDGLREGHLYSREVICGMNAHSSQQRGVSGNKKDGCDAIVVAGKGEVQGTDTILELTYSAYTGRGAEGMLVSQEKSHVVRVFRTSKYEHANRAIVPGDYGIKKITGAYYRYDGLYEIKKSEEYMESDDCGKKASLVKTYIFQLSRCGVLHNKMGGHDYIGFCRYIGTLL
jgi:SAD/SRA domain